MIEAKALQYVSPALRGWNSWKQLEQHCAVFAAASHQPFAVGIVGNMGRGVARGFAQSERVSPALRGWNSWKLVFARYKSSERILCVSPALRGWNSWKHSR